MTPKFSWDPEKDRSNRSKHGISFKEAATVFADPLSLTRQDPDHSWLEQRYITLGISNRSRFLVIAHCDHHDLIRIISARSASRREIKQYEIGGWIAEMRSEYDFSDGIRGKYANRFSDDCVLVPLDQDVAQAFPDAKAVNDALRSLISGTADVEEEISATKTPGRS